MSTVDPATHPFPYRSCVIACARAGLVRLPEPDAPELTREDHVIPRPNRGVATPMIAGDGTSWAQLPTAHAAVAELRAAPRVKRGDIVRVAYKHRAPYQAVRYLWNRELIRNPTHKQP